MKQTLWFALLSFALLSTNIQAHAQENLASNEMAAAANEAHSNAPTSPSTILSTIEKGSCEQIYVDGSTRINYRLINTYPPEEEGLNYHYEDNSFCVIRLPGAYRFMEWQLAKSATCHKASLQTGQRLHTISIPFPKLIAQLQNTPYNQSDAALATSFSPEFPQDLVDLMNAYAKDQKQRALDLHRSFARGTGIVMACVVGVLIPVTVFMGYYFSNINEVALRNSPSFRRPFSSVTAGG